MVGSITQPASSLHQSFMTSELANGLTERLLRTLMSKPQIENIEDDRYMHVMSRTQSRFTAPVSPNEILSMEFHPSGNLLAYARIDGSLTTWSLDGKTISQSKKIYLTDAIGREKIIHSLSWNPSEPSQFATVGNSSEISIWGFDERKTRLIKFRTLSVGSKLKLFKCCYDPSGNWLLTLTKSEEIHIFNVRKDYELHTVFDAKKILIEDSIYSICWDNSGTHIFLGFKSGKLLLLHLDESKGFKVKMSLSSHRSSVTSIKMDPNGRYVVSGSADGSCIIWDISTLCCVHSISDFDCAVTHLEIDSLGKVVAICTTDGIRFHDLNSGKLFFEQASKNVNSNILLKFKPELSEFITTGSQDILQRHFTPPQYHDIISLWKAEHDRSSIRSKSGTPNSINENNNRKSNKRERDQDRLTKSAKRERSNQRISRFGEKR